MSLSRLLKGTLPGSLLAFAFLCSTVASASAEVIARISQSNQRMLVYVDGALAYDWPVSTARRGYVTPNGSFRVGRMAPMWYSRKYDNSPMPHSLFFYGGYAIHGTYAVGQLGRRASHGCIRLAPRHARELYGLTQSYAGTRVVIED